MIQLMFLALRMLILLLREMESIKHALDLDLVDTHEKINQLVREYNQHFNSYK